MSYNLSPVKELSLAGMNRVVINLKANRANGEFFSAIEGQFFYVEAVDFPCRVAFTKREESLALGMSAGFQFNMPFSGIMLYHDDYTNVAAVQELNLIVYTSRDPRSFNQFVEPSMQMPLPYNFVTDSTGIRMRFPIPPRTRFLRVAGAVDLGAPATVPTLCIKYALFYNSNGAQIISPTLPGYTAATGGFGFEYIRVLTSNGGLQGKVNLGPSNINIPTSAVSCDLLLIAQDGSAVTMSPYPYVIAI